MPEIHGNIYNDDFNFLDFLLKKRNALKLIVNFKIGCYQCPDQSELYQVNSYSINQ